MKGADQEEWRPVFGAEDRYEVSNFGRVRTRPRIMSPSAIPSGHLNVSLGSRRREYVHRLVAEAFLDRPCPTKIWVNHKNGNPKDNRAENLEWCTPGENIAHGYRENGRINYNCIKVRAADDSGEVVREYVSVAAAARAVGVTQGAIHSALRRGSRCQGFWWFRC